MDSQSDVSTVDLAGSVLRLRQDLTFVPQHYHGRSWVHIEVTGTSAFYRVGFAEYVFLSLLDGNTTFAQALALTAQSQGATALSEEQAAALYRWLLDEELGEFADAQVAELCHRSDRRTLGFTHRLAMFNPFWLRIPLGQPDAALRILKPAIGWMFSVPAMIAATAFILLMGLRLYAAADELELASRHVFARDNWIWLCVAWVGLKVCHESAHGLVCQRYGGTVGDSGIIMAFFAPLAYVDVTSSWAFNSRWQRIHTALAGIYVELVIAALAGLWWLTVDPSQPMTHLLYNVMLMASLSTVLFNANPLMRFDGYYVLSDLLQIPNLSSRSSEVVKQVLKQLLFGAKPPATADAGRRRSILLIYGMAAAAWKVLICTSLVIAASVLFHGAGIVIAIVGVVAWLGVPAGQLAGELRDIGRQAPLRVARAALVAGSGVGVAASVLFWMPVPFGAVAPGVVELAEGSLVRAQVDGFVDEIHVKPGQEIAVGDRLLTLRNPELQAEYADLQIQVQQASLRRSAAVSSHEFADAQVASDMEAGLNRRLNELAAQVDALSLEARVAGKVVLQNLDLLRGRYVQKGDEILLIENHLPRQLHISVAQEDQPVVQAMKGSDVHVRIGTRGGMWGQLVRVTPRATLALRHNSLAAAEGGSLAVTASDKQDAYELTEHRFEAVVELPGEAASGLCSGERGHATFAAASPTLAGHVYHIASEWLDAQFHRARRERF